MGRTEYYYDPHAPQANSLIPASNLLVVDERSAILLQRRRDTGQWALPVALNTSGKQLPSARSGNAWKRPASLLRSPASSVSTPTAAHRRLQRW
jgi:hypothetical protein